MAKIFFRTNHSTKLLIKDNGDCKVTNCSPNPKDIENGNEPNKPNTINL